MNNLHLFDFIATAGRLYLNTEFVSNGFVATRHEGVEIDNRHMTRLIERLKDKHGLTTPDPLGRLDPIGEWPAAVAFSIGDPPKPPLVSLAGICFVDHALFEVITRCPYETTGGKFSYRFYLQPTDYDSFIPVISFYDLYGELIGFCAGLNTTSIDKGLLDSLNQKLFERTSYAKS